MSVGYLGGKDMPLAVGSGQGPCPSIVFLSIIVFVSTNLLKDTK